MLWKTDLSRCNAQTRLKLAKALDLSREEILLLNVESRVDTQRGKPKDTIYSECNLSPHLAKVINDYVQSEKDKASYMDCLWGELYGPINSDLWSNCITEEQAQYLRTKYLYGDHHFCKVGGILQRENRRLKNAEK